MFAMAALVGIVAGCASPPAAPDATPAIASPATHTHPLAQTPPPAPPSQAIALPSLTVTPTQPAPAPSAAPSAAPPPAPRYDRASWSDLRGWGTEAIDAWSPWLRTCAVLQRQPLAQQTWQRTCAEAARVGRDDADAQRRYFEANFTPYRLANANGTQSGLVTGYYEPLLTGSRKRTARFKYPLLSPPPDLVAVDLGETNPEIKDRRVRGRIVPGGPGGKLVPYYARADITNGTAPVKGREIAWVEDPVELFFLQVQGSGRIQLPDGSVLRVGYADHNGHPYRSIGRWLVDNGELSMDQASMQGIKAWVKRNPARADELFNQNPAYVFFREMPAANADQGPVGSMGIALTPGASIAVDPRTVPLGTPVWLATTWPLSARPLNRLMLAHDTGSAIRGAVRADFFWGFGQEAADQAGRMKQQGAMWMLWPNGEPLPSDM